jgi:hypothetical protein
MKVLYKSSAENRTSTTTVSSDANMYVTLAVGYWRVQLYAFASGDPAGDLRTAWTFSGGSGTGTSRACIGPSISATALDTTSGRFAGMGLGTLAAYGVVSGATAAIYEDLFMNVTSSGTLSLQWAQNTSSSTATTLSTATHMFVTQLTYQAS